MLKLQQEGIFPSSNTIACKEQKDGSQWHCTPQPDGSQWHCTPQPLPSYILSQGRKAISPFQPWRTIGSICRKQETQVYIIASVDCTKPMTPRNNIHRTSTSLAIYSGERPSPIQLYTLAVKICSICYINLQHEKDSAKEQKTRLSNSNKLNSN